MRLWPLLLFAAPVLAQYPAPADWDYKGDFRVPQFGSTPRYHYGMTGMTFYDECGSYTDPTPSDGYPGCICAVSNNPGDNWGCFDIIPPEVVSSGNRNGTFYDAMDEPTQVVEFFDASNGIQATLDTQDNSLCEGVGDPWDCCIGPHPTTGNGCTWVARDQPGMVIYDAPNDLYVNVCGHDWYNTTHADHESHCWGDLGDLGASATGAWGFDNGTGEEGLGEHRTVLGAHADRVGWYLGEIPQDWANTNLAASGTQMCFTGMYRESGGVSSGPTLYSFPCAEPGDADDIDPTPLISYHSYYSYGAKFTMPNDGGYGPYDYPPHTMKTQCRDAVWINVETDLVAFSCTVGGPVWWYGQPALYQDCNAHRNNTTKFHTYTSPIGTLAVTLDGASETAIVIDETISTLAPTLVPGPSGSAVVEVEKDAGDTYRQFYQSYSGSTFTISSTNYTTKVATAGRVDDCTAGVGECEGEGTPYTCCEDVDQGTGGECDGVPYDCCTDVDTGTCDDVTLFCNITDEASGNSDSSPAGWLSYGSTTAPEDLSDPCFGGKGYKSINAEAPWYDYQIQFYLASDLADVASELKQPWEIAPYTELDNPDVTWSTCNKAAGITFDGTYLYAAEDTNKSGRIIIHVWEYLGEGELEIPPAGTGVSSDGVTDSGAEG